MRSSPSYDPVREMRLVCAEIIAPDAAEGLADLDPAIFGDQRLRPIHETAQECRRAGRPLDGAVVLDALQRAGRLQEAGGAAFVTRVVAVTPTGGNYRADLEYTLDQSNRRALQVLAEEAGKGATDLQVEPRELAATMASRLQVIASANGGALTWPEKPLVPRPPDPDPLPLDAFPPVVAGQIASIAGSLQVPGDLPAVLALAACSTALAGRVAIRVRPGWVEPCQLYLAVILPPGSRKSPAFEAMTSPIREWEAAEIRQQAPLCARWSDELRLAEKRLEAAILARAKGSRGGRGPQESIEAAREHLDEVRAREPQDGRLLLGDTPPEAMVLRIAKQNGRAAFLSPEPGPLEVLDGRYGDRARLDELKRAHSGESFRVDRVSRPSVYVARPAVTFAVLLQTGVLESLQNAGAFRREGMLARMLMVMPPHGLGSRLTGHAVPALDEEAAARYAAAITALLKLQPHSLDEDGTAVPHELGLSAAAAELLVEFEAEVEAELGDDGRLASIRDWGGKAVGQAVRVAANLELAGRAGEGGPLVDGPIGSQAVEAGIRLVRALSTHALAILGGAAEGSRLASLDYIIRRLRQERPGITERELREMVRGRRGVGSAGELADVLDELEGYGCIRRVQQPASGRGRPGSPRIYLHQHLRGGHHPSGNGKAHGATDRARV